MESRDDVINSAYGNSLPALRRLFTAPACRAHLRPWKERNKCPSFNPSRSPRSRVPWTLATTCVNNNILEVNENVEILLAKCIKITLAKDPRTVHQTLSKHCLPDAFALRSPGSSVCNAELRIMGKLECLAACLHPFLEVRARAEIVRKKLFVTTTRQNLQTGRPRR